MKIEKLNLTLHNGRKLLTDCTFSLSPGDKLAVIGEEGNGKSSLLQAIYQPEALSHVQVTGQVLKASQRLGLLQQQFSQEWLGQTALEFLLTDFPGQTIEPERFNELANLQSLFVQVGLPVDIVDQDRPLRSYSGGEKVKLRLAKLLKDNPDVLLLDEPTNDLDLETLTWLEQFVQAQTKPVMFISHDIVFLERTANCILHLENVQGKKEDRYRYFRGRYADYVGQRQQSFEKQVRIHQSQERQLKKQLIELNDQKNAVRSAQINTKDPSARRILNKKMANILAVKDRLDRTDRTDMPHLEEAIAFVVPEVKLARSSRVLDLDMPGLWLAERQLTGPIRLTVMGGEAICLVGSNGVGKTTLLRQIAEVIEADPRFQVGVFPQDYQEAFLPDDTPISFLARFVPDMTIAQVQLGSVRFTREEMERPVRTLSSGQQAKLILTKLVLMGCNVILADEPTRNVSPLSAPVIHQLFDDYQGTIIAISHDRRFIERVAHKVYQLTSAGLEEIYLR